MTLNSRPVRHLTESAVHMAKTPLTIGFLEFPACSTADIVSAKRFYSAVFGWSFTDWGDDYADTNGGSSTRCGSTR